MAGKHRFFGVLQRFEKKYARLYVLPALLLLGAGCYERSLSVLQWSGDDSAIRTFLLTDNPGGADYLYAWFLNRVFFLFGNVPIAGVIAHVVLQVLLLCLVCGAVAHFFGATLGMFCFAAAMLHPYLVSGSVESSHFVLYFLVWSLGLFVISRKRVWEELPYLWLAEACVCSAVAVYLHPAGMVLAVILLLTVLTENDSFRGRVLLIREVICLLGTTVGFLILAVGISLVFGVRFQSVLGKYVSSLGVRLEELIRNCNPFLWIPLGVFLPALCLKAVLNIWYCRRYGRTAPTEVLPEETLQALKPAEEAVETMTPMVSDSLPEKTQSPKGPNAESENLAETSHRQAQNSTETLGKEKASDLTKTDTMPSGAQSPDSIEETNTQTAEETPADEKPCTEEPLQQPGSNSGVLYPDVELLESPLPLPKKREKKAVDFAIDVPEEDDYDYPVDDDDDFDV